MHSQANNSKALSPPPPAYEPLPGPSASQPATPRPLSPMPMPQPQLHSPRGGTLVPIVPQAHGAHLGLHHAHPHHHGQSHPHGHFHHGHHHVSPPHWHQSIGHFVTPPGFYSPPHVPSPAPFPTGPTQPLVYNLPNAYYDARAVQWLAQADARARRRFWGAFLWAFCIWWILWVFISLEMRLLFGHHWHGGHGHGGPGHWNRVFGQRWASS